MVQGAWLVGDKARQRNPRTLPPRTESMYSDYLYSAGETPVSRQRFVQDLAYLGVPETRAPDGTCILTRR